MKKIITLFSIFYISSISYANQDYSVSVGYEADVCSDVPDGVECVTYFDILTNGLFKDEWGDRFGTFHLDYYDAILGEQKLYCAILSDYVRKYENAPKFYDDGMKLLDKYTSDYAVRDLRSYADLRNRNPVTDTLPHFHQSWLIDNKDVLKGIMFASMSKVFSGADAITKEDPYKKKIQKNLISYMKINAYHF